MLTIRFVAGIVSIGLMVLGEGVVSGQEYPNKPVRIVTGAAGGGLDFASRLIAPGLTGSLGQPVIVDNRGGVTPPEVVSTASPDGYTLLLTSSRFWTAPLVQKTPYDPVRDFSPITSAASHPNILVVHPSVAANSVKELIALAKAKPGVLNYSSGGTGGTTHLSGELFKSMAGVNIVRVGYKSDTQEVLDLVSGQVQMTFGASEGLIPYVTLGKLRVLAVTSARSSALFPGLPTVAATVPGFEAVSITGIFVPAKTPEAIINRLNREIVRVLNQADVKQKFFDIGTEIVGSSPAELATAVKSEMARMGKLIKDAGIKVD